MKERRVERKRAQRVERKAARLRAQVEEAEISKGIISALEEEINVMSDVPSNDTAGCEEEVNSRRLKGASKE